jgi:hypothetical protein
VKFRHAAALALTGWYLMVPPHYVGQQKASSEYRPEISSVTGLRSGVAAFML